LICQEQRGEVELPGGPLLVDDVVFAFHAPPIDENPRPYLGHVLLTPRRHAPGLDDLTDEEGAAIGVAMPTVARALREAVDPERIYSMVVGHHVPHLHIHLFPRYRGTPEGVSWLETLGWEGSPRGGPAEIAELVERLRARLEARE
jgi:histidine triad (HIT) family protein